jgi:urease accessory protein
MSALAGAARGWRARLALGFTTDGRRTALTHHRHRGPLLVQRPFYPEGPGPAEGPGTIEPCHVYVLHPPGGVASGDELALEVDVRAGAHALITTPAAAKFYRRSHAGLARVHQSLRIDAGTLEWLPQEGILYPDAAVELESIVRLSDGQVPARFIGWEIGCLGLPARAPDPGHVTLRQRLEVWRGQHPLLLERLTVDREVLAARWGLGGHAAFGTVIACPAGAAEHARALEAIASEEADCAQILLACTLVDGVLLCRGTARRTDRLRAAFVRWWQVLRPAMLAREAVSPRIWST